MSELEKLLATVRRHNTDVSYCRNEGNGSVPVHYVDDLTTAVYELLTHLDDQIAKSSGPLTCSACSHSGEGVRRVPGSGPLDLCADPRACADRNYRAKVGDLISENARDIPTNVLEFVDCDGDVWRRPADDAEATHDGQRYDWVTTGGWSTTEGRLGYAPLRVIKVKEVTHG